MPESESTNRVEMVTHTHTQRATAWLCLAVAVLIALMPAAGVMVCLGHNGHVGIGVPTKTSSCPCEHHSATEDEPSADLAKNESRHPPCSDIALDPPEGFSDAGLAKKLPKPAHTPPDDDCSPPVAFWAPDHGGMVQAGPTQPSWVSSAAPRPREHLEHKRSVVLLI